MNFEELPTTEDFTAYDWREVTGFTWDGHAYTNRGFTARDASKIVDATLEVLHVADIAEVLRLYATTAGGVCHDLDAVIVVALHDGRWALCEAWTDCTGWGCQDGVDWWVGSPEAILATITPEQQRKLDTL